MLIYVDKKKEKQKRIKIISAILCILLIIIINVTHFNASQNSGTQNLATYQVLTHSNPWYDQASPVYLFSSNQNSHQNIIIIPQKLNKETATILAATLSSLPNKVYSLNFTPEVQDKTAINKITKRTINLSHNNVSPNNILISTELKNVADIINQENLYPTVMAYKKAQKILNNSLINVVLNNIFPEPSPVKGNIEKEQKNLQTFAKDNYKYLKKFILKHKEPPFAKQNLFLQNVRLCLVGKNKINCSTSTENSLKKNITLALHELKKDTPHKLILWTSNFPLSDISSTGIAPDEGIYFKSQNRESFLLPQDINVLTNRKEITAILKRKVGLNPQYTTPDMKLYKFKITEIDL